MKKLLVIIIFSLIACSKKDVAPISNIPLTGIEGLWSGRADIPLNPNSGFDLQFSIKPGGSLNGVLGVSSSNPDTVIGSWFIAGDTTFIGTYLGKYDRNPQLISTHITKDTLKGKLNTYDLILYHGI